MSDSDISQTSMYVHDGVKLKKCVNLYEWKILQKNVRHWNCQYF